MARVCPAPPLPIPAVPAASLALSTHLQVPKACTMCRLRRVRCTGVQPCAMCERRGEECSFEPLPPQERLESTPNKRPRVLEEGVRVVAVPAASREVGCVPTARRLRLPPRWRPS